MSSPSQAAELPPSRSAGLRRRDFATAGLAIAVVATLAFGAFSVATDRNLGTALPPFMLSFEPGLSPFVVLSVLGVGVGVWGAVRLFSADLRPFAFGTASLGLALGTRVALNVGRGGPDELWGVFDVGRTSEASHEYLPSLGALREGVGPFLRDFDVLAAGLPTHSSGHPPGLLLLLHGLGIQSAEAMAALTIVVGALAVPLTYAIGRLLLDERGARFAALLCALAPSTLLYGATSADALFATLGLAAAGLLLCERRSLLALGAVSLAIASFFSYALLAVGAWAFLLTLLRSGWRRAAVVAAGCALALIAFYAGLALITGFDLPGSLHATSLRYRGGIASVRPYLFWLFGSPVAFLVALGLPIAWLGARSLARGENTAIAVAAVIAVSAVLGYTKAETERIWLFFVPLVCLAAATSLRRDQLPIVLTALAVQAVLVEALFITIW